MDGGDEEEVEGRITGKRSELNSIRAQGFQVYFRVAMMGGLGDGGVCGSARACVLACLLACSHSGRLLFYGGAPVQIQKNE